MKKWLLSISILCLSITVWGKEEDQSSILKVTNQIPYLSEETIFFEENLDSNLVHWYLSNWENDEAAAIASSEIPELDDSLIVRNLKLLSENTIIEFPYNDKVKAYINMYAFKRRELTETVLGLKEYYFPIFEAELDRQNLPLELKYLPVIESALNPRAFSRAGASGLWQFVYGTGKWYKMDITSYIDERRDPVIATQKAVEYLGDLYSIYKDWFLVIAAYNCGPGNVNKAIRRSGGKRDYWEIYYRLPRETRGYVPAYIAATYTMTFYEDYNLHPRGIDLPRMTDTVMVDQPLHLKQVSDFMNIPYELVRDLNPQYRKDYIPGGSKKYPLVLPSDKIFAYIQDQDSIHAYNKSELVAEKRAYVTAGSTYTPSTPTGKTKLVYTVKSGDNLGFISEWYNVRLSDLRYWNNIYRNTIRVGQKLVVYVPNNKADYYQDVNHMSFAQKQSNVGKSVPSNSTTTARTTSTQVANSDYEYYRVRNGDNLYDIARKFPGISAQNIMDLNNMRSSNISPGMLLKIRPKAG